MLNLWNPAGRSGTLDRRELLRGVGAIAFGDARDDVFLRAEIAIEIARAHPGLGADFLHRGLVKARAGKAGLRRDENFVAAISLQLDVGATQLPSGESEQFLS